MIAAVAVVGLFAAGWTAAQTFESPAQRAARAKAPAAGVVTATVTDGNLERAVSATATIGRTLQETVPVDAALASSVVTKNTVHVGQSIGAGAVVLERNGRPLFALPGSFPFYRGLTIGDHGPDVRQLQSGLNAAGFDVSDDGEFGTATARAVSSLYARSGYSVPMVKSAPPTAEATGDGPSGSGPSEVSAGADVPSGSDSAGQETAPSADAEVPAAVQVSLPADETMVFSSLPADVVAVPPVGTLLATTSNVAVESGEVIASAPVAAESAALLKNGMTGVITGPDGSQNHIAVTGITYADAKDDASSDNGAGVTGSSSTSSGSSPSTSDEVTIGGQSAVPSGQSGSGDATVRLSVTGKAFPVAWLHHSAVAIITVDVAAKDSLIVPSIAVISGAKGAAHVLKRGRDGTYSSVPVREVGALEGKSAVLPSDKRSLRAGDSVKVG